VVGCDVVESGLRVVDSGIVEAELEVVACGVAEAGLGDVGGYSAGFWVVVDCVVIEKEP